jgi:hypothetical protein
MYLTEIFYKGEDLDLYEDKGLKYTIQVNDIGEIKDRQASYTNSYEVPKTPKNIRLLGGLALPSDTSVTPYTQDKCQVKIEGFDFIVKGWLNVINELKTHEAENAIPGHSGLLKESNWKQQLNNEERYLWTLLNDIRASIKKGEVMEKAMATAAASERRYWQLFDIVNRRNVNNIYPSLEWE